MQATVVIAPDSFKGSASAREIAEALGAGWAAARPGDRIVAAPMADGGEGTLEAFQTAFSEAVLHRIVVSGPLGDPVDAAWLQLSDGTAVVELAAASGIGLLPRLAPMDAHTYGFGQAIAAALEAGAQRLLLAIGGSASTDGGTGALAALGARFLDDAGMPAPLGGRGLARIRRVDLSGLAPLPAGGAHILSDVGSPLLGPAGAAAVFGPQKGASLEQIAELEAGLGNLVRVLDRPDAPGAGAAGGTGYGLLAWGARTTSGAGAVGEQLGLPALLAGADVVITGEGRYDAQSAAGKVPHYVAGLARAAGIPALLAAGSVDAASVAAAVRDFADTVSLRELAGGSKAAIADAQRWAREAGSVLARRYRAG